MRDREDYGEQVAASAGQDARDIGRCC